MYQVFQNYSDDIFVQQSLSLFQKYVPISIDHYLLYNITPTKIKELIKSTKHIIQEEQILNTLPYSTWTKFFPNDIPAPLPDALDTKYFIPLFYTRLYFLYPQPNSNNNSICPFCNNNFNHKITHILFNCKNKIITTNRNICIHAIQNLYTNFNLLYSNCNSSLLCAFFMLGLDQKLDFNLHVNLLVYVATFLTHYISWICDL